MEPNPDCNACGGTGTINHDKPLGRFSCPCTDDVEERFLKWEKEEPLCRRNYDRTLVARAFYAGAKKSL